MVVRIFQRPSSTFLHLDNKASQHRHEQSALMKGRWQTKRIGFWRISEHVAVGTTVNCSQSWLRKIEPLPAPVHQWQHREAVHDDHESVVTAAQEGWLAAPSNP